MQLVARKWFIRPAIGANENEDDEEVKIVITNKLINEHRNVLFVRFFNSNTKVAYYFEQKDCIIQSMSSILHSETSPKSQHTHETQHSICPKESTCSSINSSCLFIRSPVLALSGLKTWRCFDWNMGTHKDGSSSVQTNICNWNSPIANSLCHSSLTKCNQLNSNLAFGDNIDNGQKKEGWSYGLLKRQ